MTTHAHAINTVADFELATASENTRLEQLTPPIHGKHGGQIDLRGGRTVSSATVNFGSAVQSGIATTIALTAPQLFGAGWKVLDLMLELALHRAGLTPNGSTWSIASKAQHAGAGHGDSTLLGADNTVWLALLKVYERTIEHRHCIVHRTAEIDEVTGEMICRDKAGNLQPPLSREQQLAVGRIAVLVRNAVVSGHFDSRRQDYLRFHLDTLDTISGLARFGWPSAMPATTVTLDDLFEDGKLVLDWPTSQATTPAVFEQVRHFDIEVPLDDGRCLYCRAEDVPSGRQLIDLGSLPTWAKWST